LFALWPALKYERSCDHLLAIAVGSEESVVTIRRRLEKPDELADGVEIGGIAACGPF
jgi:hypothetical protein